MSTTVTHHINDFTEEAKSYKGDYPWMQIGVFPTEQSERAEFDWFNYTVGLGKYELWVPCTSIENRAMGNEMAGEILNVLASAWRSGALAFGDNVIIPLGIPDENDQWVEDANSIWWVKDGPEPARGRRQVNMTDAEWCVPILWSSPLGWAEPITKSGKILTDDDIQELADEAEAGYDVSKLRKR
jgi:hypothetical protein